MSTSSIEKLMFTVGVRDLASRSINNINKDIAKMRQNAVGGFDAIRGGAFGLAGAGFAIKTFMQPVYEFQRSIGEVNSLGVARREMDALTKASLKFSMQYGESAADVVRSSYDIQSAIGGLQNGELAKFTIASNVLAKATKADAATITNYMGTMYGIFEKQANAMGKANWVHQLTGQTALAVQMFKTDGANMAAAFSNLGANATASGVSLAEQISVLGMLQATMSGSEAATKYKAYLAGVINAQEKLGIAFTNSEGRLLPMATALGNVTSKFGPVLDELEKKQLKDAFGSSEALSLITQLMDKTGALSQSVDRFGSVSGMKNAITMAKKMIDPWEQFHATTEAVRIGFGTALMPSINELLLTLAGGLSTITEYTQAFPNLTYWVGMTTLGMLGLSAVTGVTSIVAGLGKTAWAAFSVTLMVARTAGLLVSGMWMLLTTAAFRNTIAMGAQFVGWLAWVAVVKMASGVMGLLLGGMKAVRAAAMFMIGPWGLLIAAVSGLVYWVGDALGWWDKLAAAFKNMSWSKPIVEFFETISGYWDKFKGLLGFGDTSADINENQTIKTSQLIKTVGGEFTGGSVSLPGVAANDVRHFLGVNTSTVNTSTISESNLLPTFNFNNDASSSVSSLFSQVNEETGILRTSNTRVINQGDNGITKQLVDAISGQGGAQFGDVYIDAPGGMSPENLEEWQLLKEG